MEKGLTRDGRVMRELPAVGAVEVAPSILSADFACGYHGRSFCAEHYNRSGGGEVAAGSF